MNDSAVYGDNVRASNISLGATSAYVVKKLSPTGERLARPYPKTTGYSDDHGHQIFNHEYRKLGFMSKIASRATDRARKRIQCSILFRTAQVIVPRQHPTVEVSLLVKQTSNYNQRGDCVKNRKYSNSYHEFLELIGFRAIVLHHRSYTKERDETGEKERCTEHEIQAQRSQNESAKSLDVPQTHVTYSGKNVA